MRIAHPDYGPPAGDAWRALRERRKAAARAKKDEDRAAYNPAREQCLDRFAALNPEFAARLAASRKAREVNAAPVGA